jgi:hypothetical protein
MSSGRFMGAQSAFLSASWLGGTRDAAAVDVFRAGAITAVTVKPGLPLTPTGPAPYILHRGSYERYS